MDSFPLIEKFYQQYCKDLSSWLPEDIIEVNLELLWQLDLVQYLDESRQDESIARYFYVIESEEKITLVNEKFVVWIVPDISTSPPKTYTLVALNHPNCPKLELAFTTAGVYNTSKLVLRVLEKFLVDIEENETFLSNIALEG